MTFRFILIPIVAIWMSKVWGEKMDFHSFEAPFTDVDNQGLRMVSRHWRSSGSTVVVNNFARLTPDQQSKKGALWSRKALGVPEFTASLKFRISGRGKNFFGDGLGIWIVNQGYYSEGDLHGFQEKFIGVGIIFDTFRNTENLAAHRDVTVLVNDGEKTWDMMTAEVQGCNTNVRYHSDRADFSITDASRAQIIANGTSLTVMVDARNSGEWTHCVELHDLGLPDWPREAHIGLTASTGQLSDNHDVLSLVTFSDHKFSDHDEKLAETAQTFPVAANMTLDDRLLRLEEAVNKVLNRLDLMDHRSEHELTSVHDNIDSMKARLDKREESAEARIRELESIVKKEVEGTFGTTLGSIDSQIRSKMNSIEESIHQRVGAGGTGDWQLPFIILFLLLVGAIAGVYFFYNKLLKKMHLP